MLGLGPWAARSNLQQSHMSVSVGRVETAGSQLRWRRTLSGA